MNLFLVGYPKSGNTWLTSLMVRISVFHVERYSMDDSIPEFASDVNIEVTDISKSKVHKGYCFLWKCLGKDI